MNKFKTCREILLLSYADNNISDEEFVPLYDCYRSKNPDFGYQSYDVFDLENMNSADCKAEFRVEKADLPRLEDALITNGFHSDCRLSLPKPVYERDFLSLFQKHFLLAFLSEKAHHVLRSTPSA